MKLVLTIVVLSLVYSAQAGNYFSNYGDLLNDLERSYLYELEKSLPVDKYPDTDFYPDTSFDDQNPDNWDVTYVDPSPKDTRDYGEASLRDPEYMKQLPISGYQFISGGTGREQADEVKTDKVLPAYCTPPNPCPYGYTGEDNCVKNFENTPENNHRLLEEQDCPCDAEHMLNCPAGKKTIDPKSGYVDANALNDIAMSDNFMTSSKRRHISINKRSQTVDDKLKQMGEMYNYNPFLQGTQKRVVAKKNYINLRSGGV